MPQLRKASLTMSPDSRLALVALCLSMLLHAGVMVLWPSWRETTTGRLVRIEAELRPAEPPVDIAEAPKPPAPPEHEDSPPAATEPPSAPVPKKRDEQPPAPRTRQDEGIAFPLLSADEGSANSASGHEFTVPLAPTMPEGIGPLAGTAPGRSPPTTEPPIAAAPSQPPDSRDMNAEALKSFGRAIGSRAERYRTYPQQALQRGWQGRVKVEVSYSDAAHADEPRIKESSGFGVLDTQAIEMVRKACRDAPVPPSLAGTAFSVEIQVVFKLMQ